MSLAALIIALAALGLSLAALAGTGALSDQLHGLGARFSGHTAAKGQGDELP